jgi:hypothetical protein
MNPELFEYWGSSIEVIRACIEVSGNDEDTICRLTARGKDLSDAERTAYNAFLRVLTQPDPDEKERRVGNRRPHSRPAQARPGLEAAGVFGSGLKQRRPPLLKG